MPLYQVSWRQAHDVTFPTRRKWSNVLYLDAPTALSAAAAGVVGWEAFLRNAQTTTVFCYEVYARDLNPLTDDYAVQPVPAGFQRGTLPPNSGERYLPKVCLALTLQATAGRPSRKFWRVDIRESDVVEGQSFNPTFLTSIVEAWNDFLDTETAGWKDPDNQPLLSVARTRLTTREFGRESTVDVPLAPPVG